MDFEGVVKYCRKRSQTKMQGQLRVTESDGTVRFLIRGLLRKLDDVVLLSSLVWCGLYFWTVQRQDEESALAGLGLRWGCR